MQVCRMDDLWILAGHTRQDYPFILAGCVSDRQAYPQIFNVGLSMKSLTIPVSYHPVKLDILLASMLQPMADSFAVAGCTISVPDVPGFSGGVLGDPAVNPSSAGGLIENLQTSWSLATFPGGPGMAQNVKLSYLPLSVKALCTTAVPNHTTLQQLSAYTKNIGADKFIAVTDGSGPGACGAALIRSKSQEVLWRLEEVEE